MNFIIKSIIAIAGLVFSMNASAQNIVIMGDSGADTPTPQLSIDSAVYKVVYSMSYIPNPEFKEDRKTGKTELFIGKNHALFIDMAEVENDSIVAEARRNGKSSFSVMSQTMKNAKDKVFEPVIVINYPASGKILYQTYLSGDKRYIDDNTDMNWVPTDETKEILGYNCRKANLNFRGREYEAWYAEEMPLPYGPYLFHGLPGLIFEIYDKDKEYEFNLLGFEKVRVPFELTIDDYNVETVSRKDFRALERHSYDDPMDVVSGDIIDFKIVDQYGNEVKNTGSRPYNPIEKE